MHLADALLSPSVAATTGAVSLVLIGISSIKVKNSNRTDIVPLMGVLGAFVFAAQMINFSIPGTGSSGHIIGGILLSSILGPWAGFLTLVSVLLIQCLIFADGGIMALGCNIINMAAMSCLVAYPFIFKPIVGKSLNKWRIVLASVISCTVGLEAGAFLVTLETEFSGITALPFSTFLSLMAAIHLAIGVCEGVATAAVLYFVASYQPDILSFLQAKTTDEFAESTSSGKTRRIILIILSAAIILGAAFTWIASDNHDGLEWSIEKITGSTELGDAYVPATAILPDYDSTFSGIIGGAIVMAVIWAICSVLFRKKRKFVRTTESSDANS